MGEGLRLLWRSSIPASFLLPSVKPELSCWGWGGPRRTGEDILFALITSEKRPSGRANLGGSASSRDRFDYKSLPLIMPGSKVCHSVCPRDKRKQCMAHLSPRGSPPPAGPTWGGVVRRGQVYEGGEGEGLTRGRGAIAAGGLACRT